MRKLLAIVVLFVLILNSCNNTVGFKTQLKQKKDEIKLISVAINNDFALIRNEVENLAHFTQKLYDQQNSYVYNNREAYALSREGVLYKPVNDGKSAVFVSGIVPIDEEMYRIVQFTEPLDSVFRQITKSFPEVVQVYYNDKNSYNRIYPFFDVLLQYEPKLNIPDFNFYYLADLKHNPSKKGLWVSEPYVDPAGRGWMVSAIAPVYVNDILEGVPGLDVTIQAITEKYLVNPEIFITDSQGLLIAADESMVNLLGLPKLIDHKYFETIKSDTYRKEKYNLLWHKEKQIRVFFNDFMNSKEESAKISLNNTEYCFIKETIQELDWRIMCGFKSN